MSDQRNASISPRRHPVAATISKYVRGQHGDVAVSITILCTPGVNAMPRWRLTLRGSELVTGLTVASPHLITRPNALEMTAGDILDGLRAQRPRRLGLAGVATGFEQPRPFTIEM